MATQCTRCGKYGHWYNDHEADGSLKPGVMSAEKPTLENSSKKPELYSTQKKNDGGNTVQFNTARPSSSSTVIASTISLSDSSNSKPDCEEIGPLLDDGASYSAIRIEELGALPTSILPCWNGSLDRIPDLIADRRYWQYGVGAHASPVRAILGSIVLNVNTEEGYSIGLRHLVLDGSSSWVVGRNITRHSTINHMNENTLIVPDGRGNKLQIPLIDHDLQCYIPTRLFNTYGNMDPIHSASATPTEEATHTENSNILCSSSISLQSCSSRSASMSSKELKSVADKVHKHICAHADISDVKLLLQRNNLLSPDVEKYLTFVMSRCSGCRSTAKPQGSRKVSLSSLNRDFNEVVCVDHVFLDNIRLFDVMDAKIRYSAGTICDDLSVQSSILSFVSCWLNPFWSPITVRGDTAFNNEQFISFIHEIGSSFGPVPPRRHQKNVIESKHGIIRSIIIRLQHAQPERDNRRLALQVLSISNDLSGSDIISAFEMARGFSRPISNEINFIGQDIVDAQQTIQAKRNLTKILRSKAISDISIAPGDLVEVYVKDGKSKRGSWSSPKTVLQFYPSSWTVTVPDANGKTMRAAIEDVRFAVEEDSFASIVRDGNDKLTEEVDNLLLPTSHDIAPILQEDEKQDSSKETPEQYVERMNYVSDDTVVPALGDSIDVYWPLDNQFYPGTVSNIHPDNSYTISYDDGESETLPDMTRETWRFSTLHFYGPCPVMLRSKVPRKMSSASFWTTSETSRL